MSKIQEPAYADPYGTLCKDFAGNIVDCAVALGTDTPNANALFNVANGGKFAIGCTLRNTTGRRLNAFYIYRPLETTGADMGSGLRWLNVG